jgi:hypothetical protein
VPLLASMSFIFIKTLLKLNVVCVYSEASCQVKNHCFVSKNLHFFCGVNISFLKVGHCEGENEPERTETKKS